MVKKIPKTRESFHRVSLRLDITIPEKFDLLHATQVVRVVEKLLTVGQADARATMEDGGLEPDAEVELAAELKLKKPAILYVDYERD